MPSSSGGWSGAADILDLDRYMRGVRGEHSQCSKDGRLVVDGGGVVARPPQCGHVASSRSSASGDARHKHASLDSGVSDGSYRWTRRHHAYTRHSNHRSRAPRGPHEAPPGPPSHTSLHAFRTVCEQALLDQQRQIARVAELCEKLAEKSERAEKSIIEPIQAEHSECPVRSVPRARSKRSDRSKPPVQPVSDGSSDISSSSRSTRDPRRKRDKYQQECKTYKIIMSKLDELSRLFAPRPAPRAPRPAPHAPSSASVSVCDKLIATDPQRTYNKILAPSYQRARNPVDGWPGGGALAGRSPRTVTQAYSVDIAPRTPRHNVVTESVNKCGSTSSSSRRSACDPRCGFDLDDPVHLYSQAKRLRVLTAATSHVCSESAGAGAGDSPRARPRSPSLCALCRGYWRYLRRCAPPLLDTCKCS